MYFSSLVSVLKTDPFSRNDGSYNIGCQGFCPIKALESILTIAEIRICVDKNFFDRNEKAEIAVNLM